LGQAEDGWQRVQQAYQAGDRQTFFAALLSFLEDTGYAAERQEISADDSTQAATTAQALLNPASVSSDSTSSANWQPVPGTSVTNGTPPDSELWLVRVDTITRSGDAINFDVQANREYVRYSANCRTRMISRILQAAIDRSSEFVPERVQEEFFPADNSVQRGLVLDFACAQG